MDEATIYQQLIPIFQDLFDDDTLIPTAEMSPSHVEGWDSLTNIRLFVAVEKRFGIRFETQEVTATHNVDLFVQLIHNKLRAKPSV